MSSRGRSDLSAYLGGAARSPGDLARERPPLPGYPFFLLQAREIGEGTLRAWRQERGLYVVAGNPWSMDYHYRNGRGQLLILRGLHNQHDAIQATGERRDLLDLVAGSAIESSRNGTRKVTFPEGLDDTLFLHLIRSDQQL